MVGSISKDGIKIHREQEREQGYLLDQLLEAQVLMCLQVLWQELEAAQEGHLRIAWPEDDC